MTEKKPVPLFEGLSMEAPRPVSSIGQDEYQLAFVMDTEGAMPPKNPHAPALVLLRYGVPCKYFTLDGAIEKLAR